MTYTEKYLIDSQYLEIESLKYWYDKRANYEVVDGKYINFDLYNKHYKNLSYTVRIDLDEYIAWTVENAAWKCIEHHFDYGLEILWLCNNCRAEISCDNDWKCDCKGDGANE